MTQESPRGGLKTVTTGTIILNAEDLEHAVDRAREWGLEYPIRYAIIEEKVGFTE